MNAIEREYLIAKMKKELEVKFDLEEVQKRVEEYQIIRSRQRMPIDEFYDNLASGLVKEEPITDERIKNLLVKLNNSGDDNSLLLKSFLQNLISKLGVQLNEKMVEQLFRCIEFDNEGNAIYKNDSMDLVNSMSYCCLISDYMKLGYTNKAEAIFCKIIDGSISEDMELLELVSILRKHQDDKGQEMLPEVLDAYERIFLGGSKEAIIDNLRKLLILIDLHRLSFKQTTDQSHYSNGYAKPTIYLNNIINDDMIIFHEIGHAIDEYFSNKYNGVSADDIFKLARMKANRSRMFAYTLVTFNDDMIETKNNACNIYDEIMLKEFGSIEASYIEFYKYVHYVIESYGLEYLLKIFGVSEKTIDTMLEENEKTPIDEYELAKRLYSQDKKNFASKHWRTKKECCVSDIISAVFKTRNIFVNNDKNSLMVAHDSFYYYSAEDAAISEILANYNVLKVTGSDDQILALRQIFGDHFVDCIEDKYRSVSKIQKKEGAKVM